LRKNKGGKGKKRYVHQAFDLVFGNPRLKPTRIVRDIPLREIEGGGEKGCGGLKKNGVTLSFRGFW